MVSLVAWLDGHEASPHDRAGEAELHGCVSEIRSLRRTMAWSRSVAGVARLLGRDQVTALHGYLAEISCWRCTVAWPRSGHCVARLLGRDQVTDPHGCLAEIPRRHAPGCLNVCFCCLPLFGASTVPWLWKKFWKCSRSLLLP